MFFLEQKSAAKSLLPFFCPLFRGLFSSFVEVLIFFTSFFALFWGQAKGRSNPEEPAQQIPLPVKIMALP
jgi:hypothetical protein